MLVIHLQENQDRAGRQQKKKLEREREQRNAQIEMLRQGKKPRYQRKCKYRVNKNVSFSIVCKSKQDNSKCMVLFSSS